ncbi:ABC transporter ATP-binding protein [Ancylobacter dichloromethanicus]|uniref:Iron ABC transporter ATP-binding protein n=1 Tax=Ancylobacter dichloromethanicus TaxID=518825 RepID=A0A9W6J5P2_9HYPH|nr:ABC transporter ATP-binding protein [Ancylobacter dichloromethanicus]MBS7554135.1 ABC transporter ATP-binding protein [Ancylobacter dichloromethanicus]GLK71251.1 iron ABC transporter ATP-binding protein [Ancylobacter dichloromethanicus]
MPSTPSRTPVSLASRLVIEDVRHGYDEVEAVRGVSLTVEPGEIICLLGQSGCGKTTLLRLIAGIERPTTGRILLDRQVVAGPDAFVPPEKRAIGLVFQDYALFPHLTNVENVAFGLRRLGREGAHDEALRALQRVRLEAYAESYPHALSGGEQQRVALARALVPRPGILLMDEPFSGLDSRLRGSVRAETLKVLRDARATCIIVTHDPEEAMRLGDRIALMRKGKLVQVGPPEELYRHPADLDVARFFCEINEVEGVVRGARVDTPLGRLHAPDLAEGSRAVAAIRPQGVELKAPGSGVPGRIVTHRFLGELDLYEVAVEGLDRPLVARRRTTAGLLRGHDVGVNIDPAEVLVFAAGRP